MVRVLGRINGLLEPFVTLAVDTAGHPSAARAALIDEAAAELRCERCVPHDAVKIYLSSGAVVKLAHIDKDDEIYFAFDGADFQQPEPPAKHQRLTSPPRSPLMDDEQEAEAPLSAAAARAITTVSSAFGLESSETEEDEPVPSVTQSLGQPSGQPISQPELAVPIIPSPSSGQRESLNSFFERLDQLLVKTTVSIEIADAFEWHEWNSSRAAPDAEVVSSSSIFLDATLQRSGLLEWRTRCTAKPVGLAQIIRLPDESLDPIKNLFHVGWFRPFMPGGQVSCS